MASTGAASTGCDTGKSVACVAKDSIKPAAAPAVLFTNVNFNPAAVDPKTGEPLPYVTVGPAVSSSKNTYIWANCYARLVDPRKPTEPIRYNEDEASMLTYTMLDEGVDFSNHAKVLENWKNYPYLSKLPDNDYHKRDYTELHIAVPAANEKLVKHLEEFQRYSDEYMYANMTMPKTKLVRQEKAPDGKAATTSSKEFYPNAIIKFFEPAGVDPKTGKAFNAKFKVRIDKGNCNLVVPNVKIIEKGEWVITSHIGSEKPVEGSTEPGLTVGEQLRRTLVARGWIPDDMTDKAKIKAIVWNMQFQQINLDDVERYDRLILNVADSGVCVTPQKMRRGMIVTNAIVLKEKPFFGDKKKFGRKADEEPQAFDFVYTEPPPAKKAATETTETDLTKKAATETTDADCDEDAEEFVVEGEMEE